METGATLEGRKMNADQIKAVLESHRKWGNNEGGERANLSGVNLSGANLSRANLYRADLYLADLSGANLNRANLSGANLTRANLSGANLSRANLSGADLYLADLSGADLSRAGFCGATGNLTNLKSIFLDTYQITYTAEMIQIGCQQHPIADWLGFSDAEIKAMDGEKALDWWKKYKPLLMQIIELSPAEPTKSESAEGANNVNN